MIAITPKQGKIIALVILMLAVTTVMAAVIVPVVLLHRYYDATIEDKTMQLSRYYKIASMSGDLRKNISEIKLKGSAGYYLKSTNPSLAAAEMQELAKGAIESNGGKLTSIQILPYKDESSYRRITVNLQFTGSLGALKKILYALESSRPYLLIENFTVRSSTSFTGRAAPNIDPELNVQFDLAGYNHLKGVQ